MGLIYNLNSFMGDRMTPAEILTMARARYNAVSDSFFTDLELYGSIYQAQLELSNDMNIIEAIYTTLSVSGTRQYSFPTQTRMIKRVEYIDLGGIAVKLEPITMREDDALTLVNVASTTLGKPQFYSIFNYSLYLRPIPDTSACTIKIYSYNEPQSITATSVLEVPTNFHMDIVDYVVMQMYMKDKGIEMAQGYKLLWDQAKLRCKRWIQKRKRADAFTIVMNEDNLAVTLTGPV